MGPCIHTWYVENSTYVRTCVGPYAYMCVCVCVCEIEIERERERERETLLSISMDEAPTGHLRCKQTSYAGWFYKSPSLLTELLIVTETCWTTQTFWMSWLHRNDAPLCSTFSGKKTPLVLKLWETYPPLQIHICVSTRVTRRRESRNLFLTHRDTFRANRSPQNFHSFNEIWHQY